MPGGGWGWGPRRGGGGALLIPSVSNVEWEKPPCTYNLEEGKDHRGSRDFHNENDDHDQETLEDTARWGVGAGSLPEVLPSPPPGHPVASPV